MTRLSDMLLNRMGDPMKKFTNYRSRYPYKQVLPAALSDEVSGRKEKKKSKFRCTFKISIRFIFHWPSDVVNFVGVDRPANL